jgi:hypothetical protein
MRSFFSTPGEAIVFGERLLQLTAHRLIIPLINLA